MLATVAKRFTFEAAHQLPNHHGKCAQPHGHSYTVEVAVFGEVNATTVESDEGMVLDFDVLTAAWKAVEDRLDHRDLNVSIGHECWPTTAENIAAWLARHFATELAPTGRRVEYVQVWETAKCWARVEPARQPDKRPHLAGSALRTAIAADAVAGIERA